MVLPGGVIKEILEKCLTTDFVLENEQLILMPHCILLPYC